MTFPSLTLLSDLPPVGGSEIIILVVFCLLGLATLGLWLWSLIHCIRNPLLSDTNRIIGIVLIVVLGIFGSLVYLFLPRNRPIA